MSLLIKKGSFENKYFVEKKINGDLFALVIVHVCKNEISPPKSPISLYRVVFSLPFIEININLIGSIWVFNLTLLHSLSNMVRDTTIFLKGMLEILDCKLYF